MKKVDQETFDFYVKSFEEQKRNFVVEEKRSFKKLIMRGKTILSVETKDKKEEKMNKEQRAQFFSLLGQVSKAATKYITENNFEVEKVESLCGAVWVNRKKYREMKQGAKFYYVDAAHCFWRIAYLRGYIGENLYVSMLDKPELKQYRQMALSCIVAPRGRKYFNGGKPILMADGKELEIFEDKKLYARIYNNIRFTAYNTMGYCRQELGDAIIAFKTDGLMVQKKGLSKAKKLLTQCGFDYKITECFKEDELYFWYDGETKKKM
jgi:hypothetical protein